MRYFSADGVMSSNDPRLAALWDEIGRHQDDLQERWNTLLRGLGVKMAHPDDDWVNRDRDTVLPCSPEFSEPVEPGDLIALGSPEDGYRIVAVTRVEPAWAALVDDRYSPPRYHFTDHGHRLPEPSPAWSVQTPIHAVRRLLKVG